MFHARTIREAAAHFRAADPHTAITEHRIRQLVTSGAIPSSRAGRKYILSIEDIEAYFANASERSAEPRTSAPKQPWRIA